MATVRYFATARSSARHQRFDLTHRCADAILVAHGSSQVLRLLPRRSEPRKRDHLRDLPRIQGPGTGGVPGRNALHSQATQARVIDPQLAAESWNGDADPLTPRQREILLLATEGASTAAIAAQLGISAGTVRNYLSEAILKLGASNRIEAAHIARGKGWL